MHTIAIRTTIAKVYIYLLPCFNISKQSIHCSWQHIAKARITKMLMFQREVLLGCIAHSRKLTAFVQHGKFRILSTWKVGVNKTFFMKLKSKKKILHSDLSLALDVGTLPRPISRECHVPEVVLVPKATDPLTPGTIGNSRQVHVFDS